MTAQSQSQSQPAPVPRRALILAGGGLKVAFQAGVLQVWLDEARDEDGRPLRFDHADGCSGGVFNLAMWCQGMTGRQIADNWRRVRPLRGLSLNWTGWLPRPASVFTYDRFRRNVLRDTWGLDWGRIRGSERDATFNLYDFTHHAHRVLGPAEMDEDALVSAVSLPVWFPPVRRDGADYIDAVFATDANLQEAVDRGADELWIVWTVSRRGEWRSGPVSHYFQMIEAVANSRLDDALARIRRSNDRLRYGDSEFGRHVTVRCLAAEVGEHYLFNYTRAGMAETVELGVQAARSWCRENGIALGPPRQAPRPSPARPHRLAFRESMSGDLGFGVDDPRAGAELGRPLGHRLSFTLTVRVADVDGFVADPLHPAAVTGTVTCQALGGRLPVTGGSVQLLVQDGDPGRRFMHYRLQFADGVGTPLTLVGSKVLRHDARLDVWADTTTLYCELFRGHHPGRPDRHDQLVGSGVLQLAPLSFLRQLGTFRAGPGVTGGAQALAGFGFFFTRALWTVYGRPRIDGGAAAVRGHAVTALPR